MVYTRHLDAGGYILLPEDCVAYIDSAKDSQYLTYGEGVGIGEFGNNIIVADTRSNLEYPFFYVQIDVEYKVKIPDDVRRHYQLNPGDAVSLEKSRFGDTNILILSAAYMGDFENNAPPDLAARSQEGVQRAADYHAAQSLISKRRYQWHEAQAQYCESTLAALEREAGGNG